MKNPALGGNRSAGLSIGINSSSNCIVANPEMRAQATPIHSDGIHVGAVWKSARDKTQCIQGTIKSYCGNPYLDLRVYALNASGRMVPTPKGITVSLAQLGKLTKLVGDAYRMASRMEVTMVSS
jgi:hypothetical protein